MAITPYINDGAVLTATSDTQGGVVPASTRRIIKSATLTNTTSNVVTVSVFMVPNGATPGAANTMISARALAVGESYPCPELLGQGLNAGGFMAASGAGVTFKYTATDFV